MVGPEGNDSVIGMRSTLQGIKDPTQHGVCKINRGKVTLDGLFPLLVGADVGEVAVGSAPLSFRRQVIEVICAVAWRQLDFIDRKSIKIFLWNKPGFVRPVNAAGQKERLILFPG